MIHYPDIPSQYPVSMGIEYRAHVTESESGIELRTRQWRFPRRTVEQRYSALTQAEIDELWTFYQARRGVELPFFWTEADIQPYRTHTDEYMGRGDGTTRIFDFPGVSASNITVIVDGVPIGGTYLVGGGAGGGDRWEFATAPPVGAIITTAFQGRLRLRMRFAEQNLTQEMFSLRLWRTGASLIEVKRA